MGIVTTIHRAGWTVNDGERSGVAVHHHNDVVWVCWEDGDETLTPANKLMSGSVASVPVALPLLERLLADADASPNNATSTYERDAIGAAIANVRAGQS